MARKRKINREVVHAKQQEVLDFMIELYGDDADLLLNALQEMATRVALAAGVTPENYAAGTKHHWDHIVEAINQRAGHGPQ